MTLRISVRIKDENNNSKSLEFDDRSDNWHLGGFEISRYEFWGHPIMLELGLTILPQLADGAYLQIKGDELDVLEQEASTILQNKASILENTPYNEDFLVFHTDNILYAIDKARSVGGIFAMG